VSKPPTLVQALVSEAIGTFALVFVGCGAVMVGAAYPGTVDHLGICLAFGLAVTVLIYATGHVSGTHINPAVSIAFAVGGHFPWTRVGPYVLTQCLAATLAAGVLRTLLGPVAHMGATLTSMDPVAAVLVEVLITFLLMFVIAGVATDARANTPFAGVAVGGTVAVMALFAGPMTGASMNPARSLGPAILDGDLSQMWLYGTAPIVGAVAGMSVYGLLQERR
jgi:aquaporin NIP